MTKYAIITYPRSGSRSTLRSYALRYDKTIIGINVSDYADVTCSSVDQIKDDIYIVCGHWHTLHLIDPAILQEINNSYKVIEIVRNPLHRFLSAILVMHTKTLDPMYDEQIVPVCLVDKYFELMSPAINNRTMLTVNVTLDFDTEFGSGASEENFTRRLASIKNSEQILERYNDLLRT